MFCFREPQIEKVEAFLRSVISAKGESSAMYISGVPGTGKTATVQTVSFLESFC